MSNPSYKFTSYPYECPFRSSPDVLIEHSIITKDMSRNEMLEQFEYFLKAVGFHFDATESIEIVDQADYENKVAGDGTACSHCDAVPYNPILDNI